jgi:hypothetical protein
VPPPPDSAVKVRSTGGGGLGSGFEEGDPPAAPDEDWGGGGGGWVVLLKAPNDIEAHLLIGRLNEAGVETTFVPDRGSPGAWLHVGSNPWAPVTVLVRRIQLEDARVVLAELAYESPPAPGLAAPRSPWRGPLVWWAAAIGLGILFTGLGLMQAAHDIDQCSNPQACAEVSP